MTLDTILLEALPEFSENIVRIIADFANPFAFYYQTRVMEELERTVPVFVNEREFIMNEDQAERATNTLRKIGSEDFTRLMHYAGVWTYAFVPEDNTTDAHVRRHQMRQRRQLLATANLRKRKCAFEDLDNGCKFQKCLDDVKRRAVIVDDNDDIWGLDDADGRCDCGSDDELTV